MMEQSFVNPVVPVTERTYAPHVFEDKSCQVCGVGDIDEEFILICDGCDQEYHTYCMTPAIHEIPTDDWFCPLCCKTGRSSELQSYFSTHDHMKHKMKTSSASKAWHTRREATWKKALETEGFSQPMVKNNCAEFSESIDLVGQLLLFHTDVHSVHTGIVKQKHDMILGTEPSSSMLLTYQPCGCMHTDTDAYICIVCRSHYRLSAKC